MAGDEAVFTWASVLEVVLWNKVFFGAVVLLVRVIPFGGLPLEETPLDLETPFVRAPCEADLSSCSFRDQKDDAEVPLTGAAPFVISVDV